GGDENIFVAAVAGDVGVDGELLVDERAGGGEFAGIGGIDVVHVISRDVVLARGAADGGAGGDGGGEGVKHADIAGEGGGVAGAADGDWRIGGGGGENVGVRGG